MDLPADRHPKIDGIVDYWRSIHPAVGLPGRRSLDPLGIPGDLLPNIMLIDVSRGPLRFHFRLLGTSITRFAGRDMSGYWMHEIYPNFEGGAAHTALVRVVEERVPDYRRGRPLNIETPEGVLVERIYLPLADDGSTVDMILSLGVFRDPEGRVW